MAPKAPVSWAGQGGLFPTQITQAFFLLPSLSFLHKAALWLPGIGSLSPPGFQRTLLPRVLCTLPAGGGGRGGV